MVAIATGFGRSGLQEWLIQRVTAVALLVYVLFLSIFFITQSPVNYASWQNLFVQPLVKYFTLFSILCLVAHVWIGLWIVTTDYIKPVWLRLPVQVIIDLILFGYLVWGIDILWGIGI